MNTKIDIDSLKFPSGRTVKRCKDDAKKLRKQSKTSGEYLSYNKALNQVASDNGINMLWDKAIDHLKKQSEQASTDPAFDWLKGQILSRQSNHKKETLSRFTANNGAIYLPDGEGGVRSVVQHKDRNNGLVMTPETIALVEKDIESMGGLDALRKYEGHAIQLMYEKPGSQSHLAYEFHFSTDGVITYFCRSQPWNGYQAELHANAFSITNVGYGERSVDTALHWTSFEIFHSILTPTAI
ncbi:TPA: hypothetical protein N2777_001637 [Vibrio parahaemolyticus]|nr:hypothetical protein [Vibrio parahaemolyticus]